MAPLPAVRFALLAVRQLSKPVVKMTVTRAQHEATITRSLCIGLGRLSLGVSSVVAHWAAEERRHRGSSAVSSTAAAAASGASTAPPVAGTEGLVTAPRSRSLLHEATKPTNAGVGRSGRLFFSRRPMQSAWQTFRTAFFAPFDEERLVGAGAEVLIELLVYSVLVVVLYLELRTSSQSAEAKERQLLQRIDALERKVNELIQDHHEGALDALQTPEPVVVSRLGRITQKLNGLLSAVLI